MASSWLGAEGSRGCWGGEGGDGVVDNWLPGLLTSDTGDRVSFLLLGGIRGGMVATCRAMAAASSLGDILCCSKGRPILDLMSSMSDSMDCRLLH